MEFDCRSCGACCRGWVVEVERDSDVPTRLVKDDPVYGPVMRETGIPAGGNSYKNTGRGQCVALRGQVGTKVGCSIYDRRPRVCRQFEVGGDDCLEARSRVGLPVPS
jgi:Fe-S-cluster containining protein